MKLGLVTSILEGYKLEEVIEICSSIGYECLEVACWPVGKASRRYAGVTHINIDEINKEKINNIKNLLEKKHMYISSLAYYPNTMTDDLKQREDSINHLMKMINTAKEMQVNMVTTFVGRVQNKSVEENIEIFKEVWPPLIKFAEEKGVKIAIENCPMLFGKEQWPGGQNLMTTPAIWNKLFEIVSSENFGLNYDPSHFIWQGIDYIRPLYEFKEKIFHIHFKDIKIYKEKLNNHGYMAYPLDYMSPKLPGLGDVNWGKYVSALTDIGYNGGACVEIEDKAFEGSPERVLDSLKLSYKYLNNFV